MTLGLLSQKHGEDVKKKKIGGEGDIEEEMVLLSFFPTRPASFPFCFPLLLLFPNEICIAASLSGQSKIEDEKDVIC